MIKSLCDNIVSHELVPIMLNNGMYNECMKLYNMVMFCMVIYKFCTICVQINKYIYNIP